MRLAEDAFHILERHMYASPTGGARFAAGVEPDRSLWQAATAFVVDRVTAATADQEASQQLAVDLGRLPPAPTGSPTDDIPIDDRSIEVARQVLIRLQSRRVGAAELAERSGLAMDQTASLLDVAGAAVLLAFARQVGGRRPEVEAWDPPSHDARPRRTDVPGPLALSTPLSTDRAPSPPVEPELGPAGPEPRPGGPLSASPGGSSFGAPSGGPMFGTPSGGGRSGGGAPVLGTRTRNDLPSRPSPSRRRWPIIVAIPLLLLVGLLLAEIGRRVLDGGGGDLESTSGLTVDAVETTESTEEAAAEASTDETSGQAEAAVEEAGAAGSPGSTSLDLLLTDPLGRLTSTGTALLDIDPDSGEVCYQFDTDGMDPPYDGHIHVGPPGVKGGIVIDFGELAGASSGCIPNRPIDTAAILDDLPGHYVEFHDPDGVNTIRTQLTPFDPSVELAAEADGEAGGAVIVIRPGAIVLEGEVPDQVTIDKLIETFADIDLGSTELVNELTIVPGSPRPSGRIRVDQSVLFEVDSATITDVDGTVLSDLARLFQARPAWKLRIVGHTDSTGSSVHNLELSLQRAEAIRDALVDAGVSPDALTTEGAGATDPIASNDTPNGRAQNRRIEFEITAG